MRQTPSECMIGVSLAWLCCCLLAVILYRGRSGQYRLFPIFYLYCGFVLASTLVGLTGFIAHPMLYKTFYWIVDFCQVLFGVCIIAELYVIVLFAFSGSRRLARFILFIVALGAMLLALCARLEDPIVNTVQAEEALRIIQAALLLVFFTFIHYFSIAINNNVRGIAIGYGWVVSSTLLNLGLRSYCGEGFQHVWDCVEPLAYLIALIVWLMALWMPLGGTTQPVARTVGTESDDIEALGQLRDHILHAGHQ